MESEGGQYAGKVYIFLGRENWPSTLTTDDADVTKIGNTTDENRLGYRPTVADINGDGISDLIFTVVTTDFNNCKIYIYYGNSNFDLTTPNEVINAPIGTNIFGTSIYPVNINGDDYSDVIIFNSTNGTKKGYLYLGGDPFNTDYDATFSPEVSGDGFGYYQSDLFSKGDIDQDGVEDFCIGTNNSDIDYTNSGSLYCWYGQETWTGDYNAADADIILRGTAVNEDFGRVSQIEDINNDGYPEIIVGAYQSDRSTGQRHGELFIFKNNQGVIETTPYYTLGYNSYNKTFSNQLLVVDWDNDGYQNIFVTEGFNPGIIDGIRVYEISSGDSNITTEGIIYTNDTTPTLTGTVTNSDRTVSYEKVETLLGTGTGSQWDTIHSGYAPSIIKDGDTYKMWYASQADKYRIGYATSPDGITWTKYAGNNCTDTTGDGCIFTVGAANTFDDAHVYSVSVVKDTDAGVYKMWYGGHDGSYLRIGYATSADGITWTRYDNPGVAACGFSEALDAGCVFGLNTSGTWDDYHVAYPQVIRENATSYKMYYTGNDGTNWRAGYATSTDGITWTRAVGINYCSGTTGDGCIINIGASGESDDYGILSGPVINDGGVYKMWYSGHDGDKWQTFYATSNNGISFTKYSQNRGFNLSDVVWSSKRKLYCFLRYFNKRDYLVKENDYLL
ncbi:MAG: Laminin G sub domain 2 [candidate division CPR3 bacterium GW2011_GWE2_35_7]|nr:MAG: Laminin G sub domain 2 [candidate division CPR3 bacterium GW2011_GWE2_35_7]